MKVPEGGLCGLVQGLLILIDGLISFSIGIIQAFLHFYGSGCSWSLPVR